MKIAMITTWREQCGIADYAKGLVAALKTFATVDVIELKHHQYQRDYFRKLGQACAGYDLVHIQHEYIFFGGRDPWNNYFKELIRHIQVPYIITLHTWLQPFRGGHWSRRLFRTLRQLFYTFIGWQHTLEAGQFKKAEKIIVHTQVFADALRRKGIPPEKICVMPQGIPMAQSSRSGLRAKAKWGLTGKVVTLFGFLIPSKGHLLALSAWQRAPENATLMIVGKPFSAADEKYAVQVRAAAKKFPRTVKMTGYLDMDELADLLTASDLVILPYTSGTSSYSLSVVLAHGCAALTSDIACFAELLQTDNIIETFPNGNEAALAKQIQSLLNHPEKCQNLKTHAAKWVKAHHWETIASQLGNVYTEAMKKPLGDTEA